MVAPVKSDPIVRLLRKKKRRLSEGALRAADDAMTLLRIFRDRPRADRDKGAWKPP